MGTLAVSVAEFITRYKLNYTGKRKLLTSVFTCD